MTLLGVFTVCVHAASHLKVKMVDELSVFCDRQRIDFIKLCRYTNLKKNLVDIIYGGRSSILGLFEIFSKLQYLVLNLVVTP